MTDREINEAIAEACGWRKCNCAAGCLAWYEPGDNAGNRPHVCPNFNYVGDLNQIHSAEMSLSEKDRRVYADQLGLLVDVCDDYYEGITFSEASKLIYATARQRCEALIKTVCPEKWKEAAK